MYMTYSLSLLEMLALSTLSTKELELLGSGVFRGKGACARVPLSRTAVIFKDELSRLRTAKVAQVTRSVLFSLKCTRNRLAAGLRPNPLGELKRSPHP